MLYLCRALLAKQNRQLAQMKYVKYIALFFISLVFASLYLSTKKDLETARANAEAICLDNVPHRDIPEKSDVIALSFNSKFMIDTIFHYFEYDGKKYKVNVGIQALFLAGTPVDSIDYRSLMVLGDYDYSYIISYITFVQKTFKKDLDVKSFVNYLTGLETDVISALYRDCMKEYSHVIYPAIMESLCNHVVYGYPYLESHSVDAVKLNKVGAITELYLNNAVNVELNPIEINEYTKICQMTLPEPSSYHRNIYSKWGTTFNRKDSTIVDRHFSEAKESLTGHRYYVAATGDIYLGFTDWNTSYMEKLDQRANIYLGFTIISCVLMAILGIVDIIQERQKRKLNKKRLQCEDIRKAYPHATKPYFTSPKLSEEECDKILNLDKDWLKNKEAEIVSEIHRKIEAEKEAARQKQLEDEKANQIISNYYEGYKAWFKTIIDSHQEEFISKVSDKTISFSNNDNFNLVIPFEDEITYVTKEEFETIKRCIERTDIDQNLIDLLKYIKFPSKKVIDYQDTIIALDKDLKKVALYNSWEERQGIFVNDCIDTYKQCLANYYKDQLNIDWNKYLGNGEYAAGKYPMWLFSCNTICPDIEFDKVLLPELEKNNNLFAEFKRGEKYYSDKTIQEITSYLKSIAETSVEATFVLFIDDIDGWDKTILESHYRLIKKELENNPNIQCWNISDVMFPATDNSENLLLSEDRIILFSMVTQNDLVKDFCTKLLVFDKDVLPQINYFSFFHCLDKVRLEGISKIRKQNLEIQKKLKEEREAAINHIKNQVSSWEYLACGLHYTYLVKYFPVSCDFELTKKEWNDRKLIWNFKNDPDKIDPESHKGALDKIVPLINDKLCDSFGENNLKHLTLVCIPASSEEKNKHRYKKFSEKLCSCTGMANAYDKISIKQDREAKHLGGSISGTILDNLEFDMDFFKGRHVLILDDIITKGHSMKLFKQKLESLGAVVVAGFAIGKTCHTRDLPAIN